MQNQTNINTSALHNSNTPQLQEPVRTDSTPSQVFPSPNQNSKIQNQNSPSQEFPAFTEAVARHDIDPRRLHKFFNGFDEALQSSGTSFPDHETANREYYDSISTALSMPSRLPAPVRAALLTLETAALPENSARLNDAILRRIPNVNLHGCCPIDCALELWFLVPDELIQFQALIPSAAPEALPLPGERAGVRGNGGNDFKVQSSELDVQSLKFVVQTSAPLTLNPLSSVVLLTKEDPAINYPAPPPLTNSLIHSLTTPPSPVPSALHSPFSTLHSVAPWPDPVNGKLLLDELADVLRRFVVLPKWAAEALALWIVHTFAFHLRDTTAYVGIESPEKRCGKTTLLTLVSQLVNRPVVASNISPPAFFRVIEEVQPTLLIDEADTFLKGNDELRGILNSGNRKKTAFVVRVANQPAAPSSSFPLPGGEGRVRGNGSGIIPPIHQSINPPLHYSTTPALHPPAPLN